MCVTGSNATIMADQARNEIVLADVSGRVAQRFGGTGTATGKFRCPSGMCTDNQGNIYVCDRGNRRVQKFNSKGVPVLDP